MSMQQVSFQGNFLKPVTIKKLDLDGTYKPVKASFIEVDRDDLNVLKKVERSWSESKASTICGVTDRVVLPYDIMQRKMDEFLHLTEGMNKEDIPMFLSSQVEGTHVYAITTQKENFRQLDSEKLLGLVEFDVRSHRNEIATLQTRPDCISSNYGNQYFLFFKKCLYKILGIKDKRPKRPYGGVGDAIVETLKESYNTRRMELIPLNAAKSFYRRHGFHLESLNGFEYVWDPRYGK